MDDERMAEGIDHLQAAALEVIEAARAFLDVAEGLVGDRDKISEAMASVAALADVARPGRPGRKAGRPGSDDDGDADVPWWAASESGPDDRLQHIDVS